MIDDAFWNNSFGNGGLGYSHLMGGGMNGAGTMDPYQQLRSQMVGGANGMGGYQGYMMGGQQGYGMGGQQLPQSYPMWR